MYFVRDADTAAAVVLKRAKYLGLDCFRIQGEIPLIPVLDQIELAQMVEIDHFGGIKSGGYIAERFKILELGMNIDKLTYEFQAIRQAIPLAPWAFWPMEESTGTRLDATGHGHDLAPDLGYMMPDVEMVTGKIGNAVRFPYSPGFQSRLYRDSDGPLRPMTKYSIVFWGRGGPTSILAPYDGITLDVRFYPEFGVQLICDPATGKLKLWTKCNTKTLETDYIFDSNRFLFVVVVGDETSLRAYVDKVLVGEDSGAVDISVNPMTDYQYVSITGNFEENSINWSVVDELGFWDKAALTPAQIDQLWNGGAGRKLY
jgi:hypothetical protein